METSIVNCQELPWLGKSTKQIDLLTAKWMGHLKKKKSPRKITHCGIRNKMLSNNFLQMFCNQVMIVICFLFRKYIFHWQKWAQPEDWATLTGPLELCALISNYYAAFKYLEEISLSGQSEWNSCNLPALCYTASNQHAPGTVLEKWGQHLLFS